MSFGTYKLLVIAGVVLLALVFATTFARGAEAQCEVNVAAYTTQAKQLQDQGTDIKVSAMEGQELKAFESVVKQSFDTFKLEDGTVKLYLFEFPDHGITVVVETAADGCVLSANQAPRDVINIFINKMSAEIDKGKA